jgi:uncharacterized protein (TIGR03790 family)
MRTGINNYRLKLVVSLILLILLIPSISAISALGTYGNQNTESVSIVIDDQNIVPPVPENSELEKNLDRNVVENNYHQLSDTITSNQITDAPTQNARTIPDSHPMNDYSDVLLVVNDNSSISMQIGDYFRSQRNIPDINICNITVSTLEQVNRLEFNRIRNQIETYLGDNNLTDKINYIITTKGIPIRISHGNWRLRASVDSELCLILGPYSIWIDDTTNTKISQVYYQEDKEFSRKDFPIYLVTRLTGYNFSDVKRLIDNAALSANQRNGGGSFLFDRDPSKTGNSVRAGNTRMNNAHTALSNAGYSSTLDWSSTFQTDKNNLAGYVSWGTFDSYYYSTPVQNAGLNQPNNEAVTIPSGWEYQKNTIFEILSRNVTINRSDRFSVNITRQQNDSYFSAITQNVTVKAGTRYFLAGYVRLVDVENFNGGGAILQIQAYNSNNDLVWEMNSTRRYGGPSNWLQLYQIPYEPIAGVTKLRISAGIAKSKGIAFFDDIYLYEIKPKNSYVPGAIAEVYGHTDAYTVTNPHWFYRLTVGDLVWDGITGVKGYVDYSNSYIADNSRVDILFDRYTSGYNLAESFYAASPYMSWIDIIIGDPKTAPYFDILPDSRITVENITLSSDRVNKGEKVTITAKVENTGGSSINNLKVAFKLGDELSGAQLLGTDIIANIPSQNTRIINYEFDTSINSGAVNIWVHVDHLNEVREQNETNNYNAKTLFINSFPYAVDLQLSGNSVYRGGTTKLFVNVSDIETPEQNLSCSIMYRLSSITEWSNLSNINYISDYWHTEFVTIATTPIGWYDIKINITDADNASVEVIFDDVFEVLNNIPELWNLELSTDSIFRTENLTVNFSAFDFEDTVVEELLTVELHKSGSATDWFEISGVYDQLSTINSWQFMYTSNKTITADIYDLKVSFSDLDNGETEIEILDAIEIKNNLPVIEKVTLYPSSTIMRREFVLIYIYGSDVETSMNNITVELERRLAFESIDWSSFAAPAVKDSYWEAVFYTNVTSLSGNYSFRARLKDSDDVWTDYLEADEELLVVNNPPVARHTFGNELYVANEDESIWFDAFNSTDIEDNYCSGFMWDFGDGNTSDLSQRSHIYTNEGFYNVTLTVYDKDLDANSTNILIKIINVAPSAHIEVNKIQSMVTETILFDGTKSIDSISDISTLKFLWDFDDNTNSTLPNVNHIYNTSGTYQVSLLVMDDNGEFATDEIFITVTPAPVERPDDSKQKNDFITMIMIVVLVIIIITVLAGVAWVIRTKRKLRKQIEPPERKPKRKPKEIEKPIETVEADIVETPEFAAATTADAEISSIPAVGAGKTVKPRKPKGLGVDTLGAAPETTVIDHGPPVELPYVEPSKAAPLLPEADKTDIPEVEVEFIPEHADKVALPDDITLPEDIEDIKYPLPTTVDSKSAEEDVDFVVPKIDLPTISDQPDHEARPEVTEAQKRGEGVSLDFKRPQKKK